MNTSLLTLFVVLAAIAAISHRRGALVVAVGATVLAAMPAWALVRTSHPLLVGALAVALAGWMWMRHGRTMATVTRWGSSSRRGRQACRYHQRR